MYTTSMPKPHDQLPLIHGRGAGCRPANRFLPVHQVADLEHVVDDQEYLARLGRPPTVYLPDSSQSIVSENDSPDIFFRYSVNPYRGCSHGCSYCYARPTHEYLGLSAGLDFETKVMVKHRAAELLAKWLARPTWVPEPITFSGVTDCYQPAEREFRITRACLEVVADCRQPVNIVTKNALVVRDLDILAELVRHNCVRVAVSVTTLDADLARHMEPRTSTPAARLAALLRLSEAGVPTVAMVAPIIPGLNDSEIPAILRAVKNAGAASAYFTLLRLPWAVKNVFFEWLERRVPNHAAKVRSHICATRGGKDNDSRFGQRMRGTGQMAEQIAATFRVFAKRCGLDQDPPPLDCSHFRPPAPAGGQLPLFR
jgi:DNA repair photolyase